MATRYIEEVDPTADSTISAILAALSAATRRVVAFVFDGDTGLGHYYDRVNSTLRTLVNTDQAQTLTNKTLAPVTVEYAADGAIALPTDKLTVVNITKTGSIAALTLADPAAAQEGCILVINTETALAHTVSNAAGSGFNGGGAAADVGTFGGAIGDGFVLVALNLKWNVIVLRNVTLG